MAGNITEAQVRHISHLGRLNPTDEEVSQFSEQLSRIIAYVEQLRELDTSNVQPTAHALPVHNVFRDDAPTPSLGSEKVLANAPQRDGSFFGVPKVLDQNSGA